VKHDDIPGLSHSHSRPTLCPPTPTAKRRTNEIQRDENKKPKNRFESENFKRTGKQTNLESDDICKGDAITHDT